MSPPVPPAARNCTNVPNNNTTTNNTTNTTNINMDKQPLDISLKLGGTKTAIPAFADNSMVVLRLVSLSQQKGEKVNTLRFEYDLVEPATDSEGGQIKPGDFGSKVFENIALYAKADAKDPQWY